MNKPTAISSKWVKTKVLERSSWLADHIPETRKLTSESLERLLGRYRMVYVKPDSGSCGIGVMRIDRVKGKWIVRAGTERHSFDTYQAMRKWLSKRIKGNAYLVQKGIHVLRYLNRPFDFRVMIQKGQNAGWKVTGTAARVAHPRKAVTNGSQGGSIYSTESLLTRTAGGKRTTRLLKEFHQLAQKTAHQFASVYPRMNELGLDIAVDRQHRAWILEVNTRPDPCPFTKLRDSSMLNNILRYARGYGRTYNLRCGKARRGA